MSTEVKNTLFRFVTMRAPELLDKEAVDKSFVQHPESEKGKSETFSSVFLKAINSEVVGKTKKTNFKCCNQLI